MSKELFRKAALDKLSSPDQLDQTIQVLKPSSWLALFSAVCVLLIAILWSIFGTITERVEGNGILMKSGGILIIETAGSGPIKNIFIKRGDFVHQGQIIGRIEQDSLLKKIKTLRSQLTVLAGNYEQLQQFQETAAVKDVAALQQQKSILTRRIGSARERRNYLAEAMPQYESLYNEGVISESKLIGFKTEYSEAEASISELQNQINSIDLVQYRDSGDRNQQLIELQQEIDSLSLELSQLTDEHRSRSQIVSRVTGKVVEVVAQRGANVSIGSPVIKVEPVGDDIKNIQAILYTDASLGKKIKVGMPISITPSTVKKEEYGSIRGMITEIATFPSTRESMMATLENSTIVQELSRNIAPLEFRADLIPDPGTPSGYKWSSSRGPDMDIESGYLCSGSVIVSEQRPISLLVPTIKKKVFGIGE
jgi:HlyD family secretion protein